MNDPDDPDYGPVIGVVTALLLVLILVPAIWIFVAFNKKYRTCVQLENGLNLGYEAVFDLGDPYFQPIAVPRFADGTPLIRDELWALFITDTTIYGLSFATKDRSGFEFAWRVDTGVVFRDENPEMYESLVSEAGHANWDMENGNIGTGVLLNELMERPQFKVGPCPTSLITW